MTFEIPGTPKRPGMYCWQIRHERQPDGSLKKRYEYMTAPRAGATPAAPTPDPEPIAPKVSRGVAQQRTLL